MNEIHCDTVPYSVTEFVGVTTREIELMTGEEKTAKRRRLNGFIWENDNKCCKMSHFFPSQSLGPRHFADSLEREKAKQGKNIARISKGNSQCHGGVLRLYRDVVYFPLCVQFMSAVTHSSTRHV